MRVLLVGDSPSVETGFSRATRAAAEACLAAGHEVAVLGISAWLDFDPVTPIATYPIYAAYAPLDNGRSQLGHTRLPLIIERYRPDIVVLLNDPWNIKGYLDTLDGFYRERARQEQATHSAPIVPWLAIDALNHPVDRSRLNDCAHVIVWTKFAAKEIAKGGYDGEPSIVPLGVDHNTFRPLDRRTCRVEILPDTTPLDAFIVGVVGRNQPRKRLDLALHYFAEWTRQGNIDDAWLYLHVAPTGERAYDLKSLVDYLGLSGRVLWFDADKGKGSPLDWLAKTYNSFDVYASTSQGEGWGLPALEAMACGIPCILPKWAAFSSTDGWVGEAAVTVACTNIALNAPLNDTPYTIGGVADKRTFISELDTMYRARQHREEYARRGLALAAQFSWERTGSELVRALEQVVETLKTATN